jgi:hypothetical protein
MYRLLILCLLLPVFVYGHISDESIKAFQKMSQDEQVAYTNAEIAYYDSVKTVNLGLLLHLQKKVQNEKSLRLKVQFQKEINAILSEDSLNESTIRYMVKFVKKTYHGFNVQMYNIDVFTVYTGYGVFGAEHRADAIHEKLRILAEKSN